MESVRRKLFLFVFLLCAPLSIFAQKNELSVLAGGYVPINGTPDISSGPAIEGAVAHRLASVPLVSVYAELPVVVGWSLTATTTLTSTNYSSLFITPGIKLKVTPPVFPLSPYVMVGVGLAHYHATNSSSNNAVVDLGGGLDMKVFPHISLRGEVRDFHSSDFSLLGVSGIAGHNLVVAGGIVLRL